MTFPIIPASTVSGGYRISRSLRFRSSASAYLSRTPASATNQTTWTWSGWVKRSETSRSGLFSAGTSSGTPTYTETIFQFDGSDKLYFLNESYTSPSWTITAECSTAAVFRDQSAWYYITLAVDTTQATGSDRIRIYVNGVRQTLTFLTTPTQNATFYVNTVRQHVIGTNWNSGAFPALEMMDGYMAEVNFIDGYPTVGGTTYNATTWAALNVATLFGAFDTNGIWQPAKYTGSYGTNGFYLPFNPSAQSNGNDSYTTALLHFDNTLTLNSAVGGSTTWSSSGSTVATNSTNGITNFNNSATFTAANTDYITSTASSDYNFTGDFTIDFWYRPTSTSNQTIFRDVSTTDWNTCSTGDYACFIDGVRYLAFQIKGVGGPYDTAALTANTWYHVAIVRSGSTITLYKDGTSVSTFSYSGTIGNTKALEIGRAITNYTASGIDGRVDEFRVSKGIARWTANFTRPSLPYGQSIGADASGAGNYWEAYNVNAVSSGTTYDSMIDSPTNYADGGNGRGNYAVLNPLDNPSAYFVNATFSAANLNIAATSGGQYYVHPTISNNTGKFYQEYTVTGLGAGGALTNSIVISAPGNPGAVYCAYDKSGQKYVSGSWTTGWTAWTANDVIGVAVDYDAGTAAFYLNGTLQGTLTFGSQGSAPLCTANNAQAGSGGTVSVSFNAGQRPFSISSVPSGFSALNTQNLPTGTITTSGSFTGNGSTDGPFVYLNGVPTAMTINGNAVTFGTHADKLAEGFKVRSSSASYNVAGSNTYSITTTGGPFKTARAQGNP